MPDRGRSPALAAVAIVALLCACGARTKLAAAGPAADAAVPPDAVSGSPDAGGPDAGGPDAASARPCARDADCVRGTVCGADRARIGVDLDPLPLVCRPDRAPAAGVRCVGEEGCGRGVCVVAGTCVVPCAMDGDCAMDERCAEVYARTGPSALQPASACVRAHDVPAGVRVTHALRRAAAPGDMRLSGSAGTLLYVLDPVDSLPGPAALWINRLTTAGPRPVVLFDLEALGPFGAHRNPVSPFGPVLTVLIPNGPRSVRSPAGYLLSMATPSGHLEDLRVTRIVRAGRGRRVDLDIFYVGGGGLRPAGERGPPRVRSALARVDETYGGAGLAIGEVHQHEVVGRLRGRFALLTADAEGLFWDLGPLLSLSAGAGGPSIPVFLIRSLDEAAGISGGVPGAAGVHGTDASGIAIAVDLLGVGGLPADLDLSRVLAHEIGHFTGLFHTTEQDGAVLDPLPDTPACDPSRDTDGDGLLSPEECAGAGAGNLMFWAASGDALSPQQGRVLVRVPVTY